MLSTHPPLHSLNDRSFKETPLFLEETETKNPTKRKMSYGKRISYHFIDTNNNNDDDSDDKYTRESSSLGSFATWVFALSMLMNPVIVTWLLEPELFSEPKLVHWLVNQTCGNLLLMAVTVAISLCLIASTIPIKGLKFLKALVYIGSIGLGFFAQYQFATQGGIDAIDILVEEVVDHPSTFPNLNDYSAFKIEGLAAKSWFIDYLYVAIIAILFIFHKLTRFAGNTSQVQRSSTFNVIMITLIFTLLSILLGFDTVLSFIFLWIEIMEGASFAEKHIENHDNHTFFYTCIGAFALNCWISDFFKFGITNGSMMALMKEAMTSSPFSKRIVIAISNLYVSILVFGFTKFWGSNSTTTLKKWLIFLIKSIFISCILSLNVAAGFAFFLIFFENLETPNYEL